MLKNRTYLGEIKHRNLTYPGLHPPLMDRGLFEAVQASECSKPYRAIPWIDDGDLHWGNTELLVTTALRFGLDMPVQAVLRRHCPCG